MNNQVATIESVLIGGDLSKLNPAQKLEYHNKVCELVGLNPLTKPFDYLSLGGKVVLYANKNCAEQLRKVHSVSITECHHKEVKDMLIVTVKARGADGREDIATSAIQIGKLTGDALANAIMKGETKAKRRVTLSICSLGMLDESELDTVSGARPEPKNVTPLKPTLETQYVAAIDEEYAERVNKTTGEVLIEYKYKLPKDELELRQTLKNKGFKWVADKFYWLGSTEVPEANKYRVGVQNVQPQANDQELWADADELPAWAEEGAK